MPDKSSAPSPPMGSPGPASLSGMVAEHLATARSLLTQGKPGKARVLLDKLVRMGVASASVHTLLGTIHLTQGATERALACFEKALELDPSDLSARLLRGEVRLNWGELPPAQEDLQYVLESGTAGSPLVQQAQQLLQRIRELKDRKRR
jgi:predicted Zn-dependent protease